MVRSARAAAGIETGLTFPFEPLRGAIVKLMLTESGSDAEDLKTGGEGGIDSSLRDSPLRGAAPAVLRPAQRVALLVAPSDRVRTPPGSNSEINADGERL